MNEVRVAQFRQELSIVINEFSDNTGISHTELADALIEYAFDIKDAMGQDEQPESQLETEDLWGLFDGRGTE